MVNSNIESEFNWIKQAMTHNCIFISKNVETLKLNNEEYESTIKRIELGINSISESIKQISELNNDK